LNCGYIDMTIPFSAGALYSTTHDLLLWEQALYGGKVLSAASLKKMTTPYKENYGCGLMISAAKGHLQYEHGGGIEGFNTEMAYYPDDKLTVIALANLNGGAPGDIAGKLAAVVHGEKVVLQSDRKGIKVSHETLAKYVGSYELAPGILITMSLDGDQFFTQLTEQPKFEVFAETEKDFFLKVLTCLHYPRRTCAANVDVDKSGRPHSWPALTVSQCEAAPNPVIGYFLSTLTKSLPKYA
jgi:hypothetical protein